MLNHGCFVQTAEFLKMKSENEILDIFNLQF